MKQPAMKEITSHHISTEQQRLGLNERLGLIGLIDEGMRTGSTGSPVMADLFNDLWDLVNKTVSGAKIDRLKPEDSQNGFQIFEIKADTGETLGRLNMLYLKKPIPCYYLVYVEVSLPFRRKGLGNRVLEYFRDFLAQKSAVGILDNIIPGDDPTYDIYFRQAWEPVTAIIGDNISDVFANYMIYVPPRLQKKALREPVMKLLHHLKRKRAAIDMRDNEVMVQRTISEFKELHAALVLYFEDEIQKGASTPLMRFMFTRFVTKLIAFRRRIADLLGYTGGESMEQIVLLTEIAEMPVQSYAPRDIDSKSSFVTGDRKLWPRLPEDMRKHPARIIESLPNYRRPSLMTWLEERGRTPAHTLNIGDLMDLGFDPTRLKEIAIDGEKFIFERVQARQIPEIEKKRELLQCIASKKMAAFRTNNAQIRLNPPLLTIRDRGNAYILRRKINAIHWEEAVEQLKTVPMLVKVNESTKCDRIIFSTINKANEIIAEQLGLKESDILDSLTCFVSWDLKANRPKLMIEFAGNFLESIWMA
ncbi:MAG: hypothetical protein JRJ86_20940 [Deltaproteobacteria bacterium]|nr:hypothetical protein [Deltaproteobacteria bacterium]MBW2119688.1 hypothetical protein [Deltaproteobacteria bacterium]MBW2345244.1 hypothetical protein [Deltaproteobacteria bacterium]